MFLELNPRQGRSSYYIHTAGERLMKALVEDVVFNVPFSGATYAERTGVWSNVSKGLLKTLIDTSLLKSTRIDSAVEPWYDFSPLRLCTLVRREMGSRKLLQP